MLLASLLPALGGAECLNDEQRDQVRTDAAPAVASVFGAVGDLAGAFASAWMKPPSSQETPASPLQ